MSRHKTDPIVMERVRQIIYDTGLSNKELSEALGLNVNTVGSWLSGRTEISVEGIRRLCQYTKTRADWMLLNPGTCAGCQYLGTWHQKCSCCVRNLSLQDCYERG